MDEYVSANSREMQALRMRLEECEEDIREKDSFILELK